MIRYLLAPGAILVSLAAIAVGVGMFWGPAIEAFLAPVVITLGGIGVGLGIAVLRIGIRRKW